MLSTYDVVSTFDSQYCWYDHIQNNKVASCTGLPPIMESIPKHHCALFGHITCLSDCPSKSSPPLPCWCALLGRPPHSACKCRPGQDARRISGWLVQIHQDSGSIQADFWHMAVKRGHGDAIKQYTFCLLLDVSLNVFTSHINSTPSTFKITVNTL